MLILRNLILIFALMAVISSQKRSNYITINFDIHLTCGKYHGAEGRLFIILRKTEDFGGQQELLDVVLDRSWNGHFKKSVIVPYAYAKSRHSFEVFFRTDCYMLNRIGECCAHEFKFMIPFLTKRVPLPFGNIRIHKMPKTTEHNWFKNSFHEEFVAHARCLDGKTVYGMDCMFDFRTYDSNHTRGLTDQIDLMQLLINTTHYRQRREGKQLEDETKMNMGYTSRRLCSPRDDNLNVEHFYKEKGFKICDHPNYGLPLGMASYERGKGKELQGIDMKEAVNCPCNKIATTCPVYCPCDKPKYCPAHCMKTCNKPTTKRPEL